MKPTKITKKLGLHKEVIATLDQTEAKLVKGGNEEVCPGPVCGSGSAYYYWQTIASCPTDTSIQPNPKTCIL